MASAWHYRSLRGSIRVDTRTDLWRLMAHARATIDLAPGKLLARECVESLRFGTPIVVPKGTVGALHAEAGGGLWFGDEAELIGCVDALSESVDPHDARETGAGARGLDVWRSRPIHRACSVRTGRGGSPLDRAGSIVIKANPQSRLGPMR